MRKFIFIIWVFTACSCQYFEKQKLKDNELVEEQLKTINWNDVDTYPTFPNCDTIIDKALGKACFQNTISSTIQKFLLKQNQTVAVDVSDTIQLKLKISKEAQISIHDLMIKPETKIAVPYIDSLITASIAQLPKLLFPAVKRDQKVATEFTLPIIIRAENSGNN